MLFLIELLSVVTKVNFYNIHNIKISFSKGALTCSSVELVLDLNYQVNVCCGGREDLVLLFNLKIFGCEACGFLVL